MHGAQRDAIEKPLQNEKKPPQIEGFFL